MLRARDQEPSRTAARLCLWSVQCRLSGRSRVAGGILVGGSSAIGIGGWPDGAGRVRHVRKLHHRVASAKQRAVCRAARKGTQRVRLASVRERRLEQRWPDDLGEEN